MVINLLSYETIKLIFILSKLFIFSHILTYVSIQKKTREQGNEISVKITYFHYMDKPWKRKISFLHNCTYI